MLDVTSVVDKYSSLVFKLAFSRTKNSFDAGDIMQEVFLRFLSCKTTFESDEHIKAFLIRTTINQTKSLFSSAYIRHRADLNCDISTELSTSSEVYSEVLKLPTKYRTVIHLFYYEDLPIAEIADILGVSTGTVKSQLHRARNLLSKNLKEEF